MSEDIQAADVRVLSTRQALFTGYFLCVLIDLTVLNLFDEFWAPVEIRSFSISILVAVLLQILLKLTLAVEHRIADRYSEVPGKMATAKRLFWTWVVLFGSKFVILAIIDFVFGDLVDFGGVIPFIVVVVAVILAEVLVNKIFLALGNETSRRHKHDGHTAAP